MITVGIAIFAIGFVVALYFVAFFMAQACIKEKSHSAEVLDELDIVCQEANKKVKSLEAQQTKVKSLQLELVETSPIPEDILQYQKNTE